MDEQEVFRDEIQDSLEGVRITTILAFPLVMLIGIPLMLWLTAIIAGVLHVSAGFVLAAVTILFSILAARRGRSVGMLMEEMRAYEARQARPELARFLARAEPWVFILAGLVLSTALLQTLVDGTEMGLGGMIFLFGAWYIGFVIAVTAAMVQRLLLRDRYASRLMIDGLVLALLLARFLP